MLVSAVAFIRAGQEEVWRGERWCGVLRGICERAEALAEEDQDDDEEEGGKAKQNGESEEGEKGRV